VQLDKCGFKVVSRLNKKLFAISEVAMLVLSVWLAFFLDLRPALAEYSWTDTIILYKHATSIYTNIRTYTNNEAFPINVKVHITYRKGINILQYYKLSANETDFIIISEGRVILSGKTYYGLSPGQKLCFTVEAKPTDSVAIGDTATVGSIIIPTRKGS